MTATATANSDIFSRAKASIRTPPTLGKNFDCTPKYIPLKKIIAKIRKTGSVTDAAKLLGLSKQAVYSRLGTHDIDHRDLTDYSDDKALSHEIIQYRIAKGLTKDDIKKMPGGSKVLAICQLDDKIQAHRNGQADKGGITLVINMANKATEIDVTPGK